MDKVIKLMTLVILVCIENSFGAEYDVKTIATLMDAYEKQIDSIKFKYSYETPVNDKEGNRTFVRGTFALKKSEGWVLLDRRRKYDKTWDNDREPSGIARSYNGEITRYLEHEKNVHGYHMAALSRQHNPKVYETVENPYHAIWRSNYKQNRFSEKLNDPNSMAKIQGEELIDGLKTINVNFKGAGGIVDYRLWLLPDKNFLPIKLIVYNKKYRDGTQPLEETQWSDFREFPGGIWYPMSINKYLRDLKEPVRFEIEEMDISPLRKEDFEFKFPAFTHVTDHLIGTSYLTTTPLEQSGIEHAPLESSLSSKEKEEVLDKYLESSETTILKDSNGIIPGIKPISEADLKPSHEVPYRTIVLACLVVGMGALVMAARIRRRQL